MDIASSAMGSPMSYPPDDDEDEEVDAIEISVPDQVPPAEELRTEGGAILVQASPSPVHQRADLGIILPPSLPPPNAAASQTISKKKDKQKRKEEKRLKKEERKKGE